MESVQLEHDADGPRWISEHPVALTADRLAVPPSAFARSRRIFIRGRLPAPFGPRKLSDSSRPHGEGDGSRARRCGRSAWREGGRSRKGAASRLCCATVGRAASPVLVIPCHSCSRASTQKQRTTSQSGAGIISGIRQGRRLRADGGLRRAERPGPGTTTGIFPVAHRGADLSSSRPTGANPPKSSSPSLRCAR